MGGGQKRRVCEPALAASVLYPGGVKNKPPFEMGVANFDEGCNRFYVVKPQNQINYADQLMKRDDRLLH